MKTEIPLNPEVYRLQQLLGVEMYAVGGIVRDWLMHKFHGHAFDPKDVDVATPEHPDSILGRLSSATVAREGIKPLAIGKSFGVVAAVFPSGNTYEIATFRQEWYDPEQGDGRRPDEVKFSTAKVDAQRRDLTMNALFYDLGKKEVTDFVGGIEDIRTLNIRPVGDASERYREDRLRVLRTLRFACRYGGSISSLDRKTMAAIKKWKDLPGVSGERIADEFCKSIAQAESVPAYLKALQETGLLPRMFGSLAGGIRSLLQIDSRNVPVVLAHMIHPETLAGESLYYGLIDLKFDSKTAHKASFLNALLKINEKDIYPYLKMRDRFCDPEMESDVAEFLKGDVLTWQKVAIKRLMAFNPKATAADFPNLTGIELGQAIRAAINNEF